jgi:acetyl esterase/lipase
MPELSLTGLPQKPLAPELVAIGERWKEAGIPDLYEGCLGPHGGVVSRERGINLRAFLYPKPKLPMGRVEHVIIAGRHGEIALRIIHPHASFAQGGIQNTLVYFHGGGFVVGDLDSHEMHAVRLANEAQCIVVNVDYRLAPENRFPCAFDDCWKATQWAVQNIARLGGDVRRLAVGGDSAGGNLAAAVTVAARDSGLALCAQLLLYPATNLSIMNGLPEQAYLGDQLDVLSQDWRASPALASSHTGLCSAILAVGPHDFLYKDNVAYLNVLRKAGVPVTYREFPTLNHGFFSYTAISKDSLAAAQLLCQDLKAHFDQADS